MNPPRIALQLWSVHHETQRDFAATVRQVAAMGYTGVELAGYGNLDAKAAQRAVADAGLQVAGMHVGAPRLRAELNTVIDEALLFGTRYVVCPWWPETQFVSASACEAIGEELAEWGSRLRAFDLELGYHNHAGELKTVGGRTVLDWILGASAPRDLLVEPDLYWLHAGGVKPETFLRDYGRRCRLIHVKDAKDLGHGPVAFPPALQAIREVGAAEWLVIEQEEFDDAPLAAVGRDLKQLQAWLN